MDTIIILNAVAWLFIGWMLLVSYCSSDASPGFIFFVRADKHPKILKDSLGGSLEGPQCSDQTQKLPGVLSGEGLGAEQLG